MPINRLIVTPKSNGIFRVVKPGAQRASFTTKTQAQAEKIAKQHLANNGGGEVTFQRNVTTSAGRRGQFRDSDTVAPANDPKNIKDNVN